jgi:hypothetical protein
MKIKLLYILPFLLLTLSGCDKSIVEPTPSLKLVTQQNQTTGKVEIYNHIDNQGVIYVYVDGNYIKSLPNYFTSGTYFGCGFSTSVNSMCMVNNLEEGQHYYEIRNSGGTSLMLNFFEIYRNGCTPINLFY